MSKESPEHYFEKLLAGVPHVAVESYMRLFDRLLLHSLAIRMLSNEEKDNILDLWSKAVKKSIDVDASKRTDFLESTIPGRAAKYNKEPDGETLRMLHLKAHDAVKKMIIHGLSHSDHFGDFEDE